MFANNAVVQHSNDEFKYYFKRFIGLCHFFFSDMLSNNHHACLLHVNYLIFLSVFNNSLADQHSYWIRHLFEINKYAAFAINNCFVCTVNYTRRIYYNWYSDLFTVD